MTYLELTDLDAIDLAMQIWYDDDSLTLDQAAAIAHDMQQVLADDAAEWDLDALEVQIAAAYAAQVAS